MNKLDLHDISHREVENVVLNFINWENPPYKIITGKSLKMKEIVCAILKKNNLFWHYDKFNNFGCLIVTEGAWRNE